MRRLLLLASLLLWAHSAYAQSVRYQSQVIGSRGLPLANQNVAVCTQPANTSTQPCSPLATLATSATTTSGGSNPLTTDINGNFFFYAASGRYTVQIYGPQISTPFVQPDTDVGGLVTGSSAGVFTNTQENQNFVVNLNGLSTANEFPQVQGGHSTTGLVTGVNIPSSSTAQNVNGLGAYVLNNSTTSFGTGAYIQAACNANTTKCTGVNGLGVDVAGLTSGVQLAAAEFDTQPQNALSAYSAINGIVLDLYAVQAGSFGTGINIAAPQVGQWNIGILTNDGSIGNGAGFIAERIGQQTSGLTATSSQHLQFKSANGAANLFGDIFTDSSGGFHLTKPIAADGTAAGLTGTGACATITTQVGGAWAGSAKCTAATAASTLTITPGTTAPNGWICSVYDETTRANLFQQTSHTTTTCVLTVTSVTQNDVFVFSAVAF